MYGGDIMKKVNADLSHVLVNKEEWEVIEELLEGKGCDFIYGDDFLKTMNLLPGFTKDKEGIKTVMSLFKDLNPNERHVVYREVLKTPYQERMPLIAKYQKIYAGQYQANYTFVEDCINEMGKRLETALSSGLKADFWFECMLDKDTKDKAFELIPEWQRGEEAVASLKNWFEGTKEYHKLFDELKKVPLEDRLDVLFKACALIGETTDVNIKMNTLQAVLHTKGREAVFLTFQKFFTNTFGEEALYRFISISLIPEEERTEERMEKLVSFFEKEKEHKVFNPFFEALGFFNTGS